MLGARVYLGFLTIRQKQIRGGGAFSEGYSASLKQRHSSYEYPHCVSATRRLALDNRPTQFNSPNTCTLSVYIELPGSRQAGREAGKKRCGVEGWREGRAGEGRGGKGRAGEG